MNQHSPPFTVIDVDTLGKIGGNRTRSLEIAFTRGYRYVGIFPKTDFVVLDANMNPVPRPIHIPGYTFKSPADTRVTFPNELPIG